MNFLPARWNSSGIEVAGQTVVASTLGLQTLGDIILGVRPEYVNLAAPNSPGSVAATVTKVQDIGTYWLLSATVGQGGSESTVRARLSPTQSIPAVGEPVWLKLIGANTCFYKNDVLVEGATA